MRGLVWWLAAAVLVLAGCGGGSDPTPTPTRTAVATFTPTPAAAVVVEATATPEPPTATPAASGERLVVPVGQSIERGGVVLSLVDVRFGAADAPEMEQLRQFEPFANALVVGALQVVVENKRADRATIHADQGTLVVGSEQVSLGSTIFFSDDVGGEFFPGVRREGSVLFALASVGLDGLSGQRLIYEVSAPSGEGSFMPLTEEDYLFELVIP